MSDYERRKWNAKYQESRGPRPEPSRLVTGLDDLLPRRGRALDVGGGDGQHAIWLAQRGLDVTLADISAVGLALARRHAEECGVRVTTCEVDLESEPLPPGPWDLILSMCFLWRPLFGEFPRALRPGGVLVVVQPTRSNLQRHAKPPEQFLLEDGELPTLVMGLEVIRYEEGWLCEGRHDAVLVARKRVEG